MTSICRATWRRSSNTQPSVRANTTLVPLRVKASRSGVHQGADRHGQFAQLEHSDVVVTSYALIRRDAEKYRGLEFDTVALDEAQHIKNRQTQNAQAVKAVRAKHRIVLTGTPLENSVLDLWSIFDFLMRNLSRDWLILLLRPLTAQKKTGRQTTKNW